VSSLKIQLYLHLRRVSTTSRSSQQKSRPATIRSRHSWTSRGSASFHFAAFLFICFFLGGCDKTPGSVPTIQFRCLCQQRATLHCTVGEHRSAHSSVSRSPWRIDTEVFQDPHLRLATCLDVPEDNWLSPAFAEMLSTELAADSALRMVSGEDVARQTRTSIERRGQPGERDP
jgi:hypothetical protein